MASIEIIELPASHLPCFPLMILLFFRKVLHVLLYFILWFVVVLAFTGSAILLMADTFLTFLPHTPLSALPLLCIGVAYPGFQLRIKPDIVGLLKACIVSSAFLLWGIDQLLSPGWFATTLGDVVITLYVFDLGWMMLEYLKQQRVLIRKKQNREKRT